ncbi:MAG TPA: hypothetical protein VIG32_09530 [Candidatus Baltobacteraceae bacterium]|jgi:hypothetical protein
MRRHFGIGVVTAAALALALIFTPLGGYASGFLTIFQPKQFTTVDISQTDLTHFKLLPRADRFGTSREVVRPRHIRLASLAAAKSHVDFAVLRPQNVPGSLSRPRSYDVQTPGEFTFTFSAKKARAYAARQHRRLPAMPANLDGTTVRVALGSVVVATYGTHARGTRRIEPFLTFVQARAPRVTSTGATLPALESYVLAMPGIAPQLASQIRALGDLSQTLPIPIRPDKQTAQRITVGGAPGLAIGDNTGLGAGVVWEKNGIVYGVAGTLSEDDVLAFANGLR